MIQVAAALLFVAACGLGLAVILAMLKTNRDAILSALTGEGAFPASIPPARDPASHIAHRRRAAREPARSFGAMRSVPLVSRAAA